MSTQNLDLNLSYNKEYYLIKDNIVYKIIIGKTENEVFIQSKNYIISFNHNDFSILIKKRLNSINEAYIFILNIFEKNEVRIKNISLNESMIIIIKNENGKEFELLLKYNNENNNIINNEIKELKKEINKLKEKNNILTNEINKLKEYLNDIYDKIKNEFNKKIKKQNNYCIEEKKKQIEKLKKEEKEEEEEERKTRKEDEKKKKIIVLSKLNKEEEEKKKSQEEEKKSENLKIQLIICAIY